MLKMGQLEAEKHERPERVEWRNAEPATSWVVAFECDAFERMQLLRTQK